MANKLRLLTITALVAIVLTGCGRGPIVVATATYMNLVDDGPLIISRKTSDFRIDGETVRLRHERKIDATPGAEMCIRYREANKLIVVWSSGACFE